MALEQKHLNTSLRNEAYLEVKMYVQDTSIQITNVSSNDLLSYSNINSIIDIDKYTSQTIATLEENMWLLDGMFYTPTAGRVYDGYISNSVSDSNGDFSTNPYIELTLAQLYDVDNFSITLNPATYTAYPKQIKVTFLSNDTEINIQNITINDVDTLPNINLEGLSLSQINKVHIEFIGTQLGNRRIRVSTLMFGKIIDFNQSDIINADLLDKTSFVADTIPSKTFSFSVQNYDKRYDIDNPNNIIPIINRNTDIMIRWGYNIAGFTEYVDETTGIVTYENIRNGAVEIEWTNFKHLKLIGVSTTDDNLATFECGSILDMMDDIYDRDLYLQNRTVAQIVANLLNFEGVSTSTIIFDGTYGDTIIDVPLPELPVRELIQLLAFACGATIIIQDSGIIRFANLDLANPQLKDALTFSSFLSEPRAEQLEYTTNISLPKYKTYSGGSVEEIQTVNVSTNTIEIQYSPILSPAASIVEGSGSIQSAQYWTSHCYLVLNIPHEGDVVKVKITGVPLTTEKILERSVNTNTLLLDTQVIKEDANNLIKAKYQAWYNKKFKYIIESRGEPLVNASEFRQVQTPFTQRLTCYILQNHLTFDGAFSGDMEVIAL